MSVVRAHAPMPPSSPLLSCNARSTLGAQTLLIAWPQCLLHRSGGLMSGRPRPPQSACHNHHPCMYVSIMWHNAGIHSSMRLFVYQSKNPSHFTQKSFRWASSPFASLSRPLSPTYPTHQPLSSPHTPAIMSIIVSIHAAQSIMNS